MKTKRNRACIVGLVCLGLILAFFAGYFFEPGAVLPEPDQCVICDGESYEAPCLVNVSNGVLGEMLGTLAPGKFQYLNCAGVWGAWNSDVQSYRVHLTELDGNLNPVPFCHSCRDLLKKAVLGSYAILDLSDLENPRAYPVVAGATYHILEKTILLEERGDSIVLTTIPTTVPLETSPWREIF